MSYLHEMRVLDVPGAVLGHIPQVHLHLGRDCPGIAQNLHIFVLKQPKLIRGEAYVLICGSSNGKFVKSNYNDKWKESN